MNHLTQTYSIDTTSQYGDLSLVKASAVWASPDVHNYEVVSAPQMGNELFRGVASSEASNDRLSHSSTHRESWGQFLLGMMGAAFAAALLYCIYSFAFTLMLRQWV